MDRGMTGAMVAGLAGASVTVVHLLEMDLSPTVYLTDAPTRITWNSNTYEPSAFLSFSDVEEQTGVDRKAVTVGLSGVDQSVIALLLIYEYINRPARIRKAVLTDGFAVIADPCLIVSGRMDNPVISTDPEAGTCTVSVDVVARFVPLGRPAGRFTNTESQAQFFAGDRGFDNVAGRDVSVNWGAKGHLAGIPKGYGPL